jgi:hypothetical protein
MTRKRVLFLLLVFSATIFSAAVLHADSYWVTFNGTGGTFKYLMQIDQNGNITKAPKAILSYDMPAFVTNDGCSGEPCNPFASDTGQEDQIQGPLAGPCSIALADKGTTQILMWLVTAQGSVFKYVIDKATMTPTTVMPTAVARRGFEPLDRNFRSLQATQHTTNRFLVMSVGDIGADNASMYIASANYDPLSDNLRGSTTAFGYNTNGTLDGTSKTITPRTRHNDKYVGVSADGLMAITNVEIGQVDENEFVGNPSFAPGLDTDREDRIYVQPLNPNRSTKGDPIPVGVTGPQVGPVDVSNPLAGGKRFVVFATRSLDDPDTSNGDNLVIQAINELTGEKISAPRVLLNDNEMIMTFFQGLAIDPNGRFVLFTRRPLKSTPPGTDDTLQGTLANPNRDSLFFQALDSNGNAVGSPKLLFSSEAGVQTGAVDEVNDSLPFTGQCQECAIPQITGIDILKD